MENQKNEMDFNENKTSSKLFDSLYLSQKRIKLENGKLCFKI